MKKIINLIVSFLLSILGCYFLIFANEYMSIYNVGWPLKIILSFAYKNSAFYIIIFLTLGVLSGAVSAFIITRYKNYNLIASMILPSFLVLTILYISFFLPMYLIIIKVDGATSNLIDWGLTTFSTHFILTLFLFLRDEKKLND